MNEALNILYQISMKSLLNSIPNKKYESFLTNKEFEANYGKITLVTGAIQSIENKLNRLKEYENK